MSPWPAVWPLSVSARGASCPKVSRGRLTAWMSDWPCQRAPARGDGDAPRRRAGRRRRAGAAEAVRGMASGTTCQPTTGPRRPSTPTVEADRLEEPEAALFQPVDPAGSGCPGRAIESAAPVGDDQRALRPWGDCVGGFAGASAVPAQGAPAGDERPDPAFRGVHEPGTAARAATRRSTPAAPAAPAWRWMAPAGSSRVPTRRAGRISPAAAAGPRAP